jgi:hypothetical protein
VLNLLKGGGKGKDEREKREDEKEQGMKRREEGRK